jgi:hypothetical protein
MDVCERQQQVRRTSRRRNRTSKRRINRRRMPMRTAPLRVYLEPGDQRLVFKRIGRFSTVTANQGYFYGVQIVQPYEMLRTSPYGAMIDVYEQMRVVNYQVKCWLPGASLNTTGSTVAKLYRDYPNITDNPTYESLLQERNMKQGRASTLYYFKWFPIEATDFDYIPLNGNSDNGRYGKIDMAGIALPNITDDLRPYFEISMTLELKYLKKQTAFDDHFETLSVQSPPPTRGSSRIYRN